MSRSVLSSFVSFVFLVILGISHVIACDIISMDGFDSRFNLKLVHQWRFNEVGGSVLKDEACGSDAHIIEAGTNNAAVLDGSVVMLGGDQNNSDYVRLPDDILSGLKNATIEIWATNKSNLAWSRIFDFGPSSTDYLMMSWNRFGDPNTDQV